MAEAPVPEELKTAVQRLRNKEPWLRYDTIVVGKGAKAINGTWFDSFAEFASQGELVFNSGQRTQQVGKSYCNQNGDVEDWAQIVYQTGVEIYAPPGQLQNDQLALDSSVLPTFWLEELSRRTSVEVVLQDLDTIAMLPAIHMPSAVGTSGRNLSAAGATQMIAGQTGNADVRSTWNWPDPVPVPAKSKIQVKLTIGNPLRKFFTDLPAAYPGQTVFTVAEGNLARQVFYPKWYMIRVWHRGPRFVQLRGAYSFA